VAGRVHGQIQIADFGGRTSSLCRFLTDVTHNRGAG
jgi:hypothetical protein